MMEPIKNKIKIGLVFLFLMAISLRASTINLPVMFMNYTTQDETTMFMAYVWEGTTWEEAEAAGDVGMAMFPLNPPGTFTGTYDVTFFNLSLGTYYVGVFETTTMMYESSVGTVGYYNTSGDGNNSSEPEGISVDDDSAVELGVMMASAMLEVSGGIYYTPKKFTLLFSYPNPFNPSTRIDYVVPVGGMISLSVFNISGQKMSSLVDGYKQTGGYSLIWDGTNNAGEPLPAGIYYIRLEFAGGFMTQKITLLK